MLGVEAGGGRESEGNRGKSSERKEWKKREGKLRSGCFSSLCWVVIITSSNMRIFSFYNQDRNGNKQIRFLLNFKSRRGDPLPRAVFPQNLLLTSIFCYFCRNEKY